MSTQPSRSAGRSLATTRAHRARFASVGKRWHPVLLPFSLMAAATAALAIDLPVARWCVEDRCPSFLGELFGVTQPLGNGFGVLLVVLAIYWLDPARRRAVARVLAMALGAGLAANTVKLLVARVRPHNFDFQGTVVDTFGQWLPLLDAGSKGQSFPSAHTATAVGLVVGLAWLYPRGRWLFATLAVLVACQRMEGGAHYLSDTLCGAAIGWLVATACLRSAWLAAPFERWPRHSATRRESAPAPPLRVQKHRATFKQTAKEGRTRAA